MNLFRSVAVLLLLTWGVPGVFAAEDIIAPTKMSFTVQPGEEFSYSLVYKSGIGGTYDLSTREFHYDDQGSKQFMTENSNFVDRQMTVFEFTPGEEKKIPIHVVIPVGLPDGDIYLSHFLRRRSDERQTFELASLMFLRVGATPEFHAKVSNVQFQENEVTFDAENLSGRYFAVTPVVRFFKTDGTSPRTLESKATLVFPEFKKQLSIQDFSEESIKISPPESRVVFQLLDENKRVIHQEYVDRYNPLFQISSIVSSILLMVFLL